MSLLKQIVVIVIAFVITAYSGGISINQHYCGDQLKSTRINSEVDGCKKSENKDCGSGISKPSCCVDEHTFFRTFSYEKNPEWVSFVFTVTPDRPAKRSITKPKFVSVDFYANPPPKLRLHKVLERFII